MYFFNLGVEGLTVLLPSFRELGDVICQKKRDAVAVSTKEVCTCKF